MNKRKKKHYKAVIMEVNNLMYALLLVIFVSCKQTPSTKKEVEKPTKGKTMVEKQVAKSKTPTKFTAKVALRFINAYVVYRNKEIHTPNLVEWVDKNEDVSNRFKKELARMITEAEEYDPEYGLGIDPIFAAQDYPEEGFVLSKTDTVSGYVVVSGKDWNVFKVIMRLTEKDGKQLVDAAGIINIPKEKQLKI